MKKAPAPAPKPTYTKLPGKWQHCDPGGHGVGELVELVGQNGFWAQHKVSHGPVFVVTTGQQKGMWKNFER
jgi:hypothetical protein